MYKMSECYRNHALGRGLLILTALLAGYCVQTFGEHQLPAGSKSFASFVAFSNMIPFDFAQGAVYCMDLEHKNKSAARINEATQLLDCELTLYPSGNLSSASIGSHLSVKIIPRMLSALPNTAALYSG
jgi:hypothetical protein